ncbi:pectinesterase inhibitor 4 [Ricinus communis]|uniref:21 kDa protein, putative n=1 Tax=Ricinus communis TaxID=3988 RepID=B9R9Q8_RICCO|nr:pectinesterase inhibitor 4 [Ricinus communis]EEF51535.1 21 kDa protein precursor, putative [Ricinus communis]|eukprot:XP_002510933.1 pectinesterase inhibitor 4 [Ricinus communis]
METKTITSPCLQVSTLFLITFLVFISNTQNSLAITTTKTSKTTYKNYLKTACNSTTYPKICYNTLSPYTSTIQTNDLKLCNAALTITLKAASNTSAMVKSLSKQKGLSKGEVAVIKDCQYEIEDSVDELKQSLKALKNLKGSADMEFQIDNIKTWISAAITDENTCTDGFEGMKVSSKVKSKIKKSIVNVNRLTSNALALINKLSY